MFNQRGQIPIIILVDSCSVSAAEALASSLKDHKRATILGKTIFSKGFVQIIFTLTNIGGALKLTTSFFYTSFGHLIQFFLVLYLIFLFHIFFLI